MKGIVEHYESCESFGRYQMFVYFLACLSSFFAGSLVVAFVFTGYANGHRCFVPFCDTAESDYDEPFLNYTTPWVDHDQRWSECLRYEAKSTNATDSCTADHFLSSTTGCVDWVYDASLFTSTTVMEFDLICDREWMSPLTGSAYMLGMLLGAIVLGEIGDHYGRKTMLLISVLLACSGGLGCTVSPNYVTYLILRLITGAGGMGLFLSAFVMCVEMMSIQWRTVCGIYIEVPFALGEAWVGVLAYFLRDWRELQLALAGPVLILISYYWILPESVLWLAAKRRYNEVLQVVSRAARVNGEELPLLLTDPDYSRLSPAPVKAEGGGNGKPESRVVEKPRGSKLLFLDLLRRPKLRWTTLNMSFSWIVVTLTYYGLSGNSGNLVGNIFVNFIAIMLIEIPSNLFTHFTINKIGRKGTLCLVLVIGGVSCILSGVLSEEMAEVVVGLSLVGKFGVTAGFTMVFIYTAELYPTEYRSVGVGFCSMAARIGGILAPIVAGTTTYYRPLPLLIFGGLALTSGTLVLLLPETYGRRLPQSLEESEALGKEQPFWYFHCFCAKNDRQDEDALESTGTS